MQADPAGAAHAADLRADESACFHCGAPIPAGTRLFVEHQGRMRPVCCHGCQAVAQAIIGGGFEAYYAKREAAALQSSDSERRTRDELAAYDDPEFQRSFARELPGGVKEVTLTLEGIRCAACVWLNEQAVQRLPGVVEFHVNLMTERATLRWDGARLQLSEVLRAIETIGYRAYPFDRARHEAIAKANQSRMLRQLFVAGIGMMQVMMYVVPFYVADTRDIEPEFIALMRWASLILTLPVVLYSSLSIFGGAWRDLRNRRVGMDVPVALAIVAAFAASTWHTVIGSGEVYFDSITMFVFLLLCGRYLEFTARRKAMQGVDALMRITPKVVSRIAQGAQGESLARVKVDDLAVGDLLEIRSGETLAVDGVLRSAAAEIDFSLLTGESVPVTKQAGESLPAGAVNVAGPIRLEVRGLGADNMISCIQRLIDRAAGERPRIATVADRIASWFLAALLLFTVAVAAFWWWFDADRALPIAIALLVVSCPCALSLATPAALAAATGALARRGFLITRGNAVETLAAVTDVVFDKTGTLTHPHPNLAATEVMAELAAGECVAIAAALERGSAHPFARALVDAAKGLPERSAAGVEVVPGRGLQGQVDGQACRIGNFAFATQGLAVAPPEAQTAQASRVYLRVGERVVAHFDFAAPIRSGALDMVARLRRRGLRIALLSGDAASAAHAVAERLGIDEAAGDLTPEDKLARIRAMQAQGRVIAMVGDGINDAPVLSGADVAIAMGDGTELAQISADIVLLSRDLTELDTGFGVARRTMRVIRENLWWSALYNGLAIPAAAFGWVTPWGAALGMSLSSLLVVLNALRLLRGPAHAQPLAGTALRTTDQRV